MDHLEKNTHREFGEGKSRLKICLILSDSVEVVYENSPLSPLQLSEKRELKNILAAFIQASLI